MDSRLNSNGSKHQDGILKPDSHRFNNAVHKVIMNSRLRGDNISETQVNALRLYRKLLWDSNPLSDIKLVRHMFYIFDGLFFFNQLGRHCELTFGGPNENILGRAYTLPWGSKRAYIRIYAHEYTTDLVKRVFGMVGTLLHEMIHAYILLFLKRDRVLELEGKTGHGFVWQEIAYALTIAINDPSLINFHHKLDLGRDDSLMYELERHGAHVVVDASKWGLGIRKGTKGACGKNRAWRPGGPRRWIVAAVRAVVKRWPESAPLTF